jgi:hypothetical protein
MVNRPLILYLLFILNLTAIQEKKQNKKTPKHKRARKRKRSGRPLEIWNSTEDTAGQIFYGILAFKD